MTNTEESTDPVQGVYPIRAVDRVCDILDTLTNASEPVALPDVAAATHLPKSSAFRYLAALEARHYVERTSDGGAYRLGLAFRPQDTRAIDQLSEASRPGLTALRDRLKETVNLGVLDGSNVVHTVVVESPHMMRLAARVGERGHVHATALGKAMCAQLPDEQVRSILKVGGMPAFTSATITDMGLYLTELENVRARGWAMDDEENQMAGRCIAVVIPDIPFPAGISVSAPLDRMPVERIDEVATDLKRTAKAIARKLRG
ncbi:IclR family transcriptional regulator [Nesterenkonia sphaerica]|uniref:IclR family transcriptional regulator n=1 Tax=Nesterenkonia sphaerica TaxID=1804988 RepID=A0A5R9APU9_9MICC|nr:IclR family transcriptional regulator [Nesterenkonia sphaerica]TLP79876.1 IclR family transcriptional regulator [Nesterenkonia sphaerica]